MLDILVVVALAMVVAVPISSQFGKSETIHRILDAHRRFSLEDVEKEVELARTLFSPRAVKVILKKVDDQRRKNLWGHILPLE